MKKIFFYLLTFWILSIQLSFSQIKSGVYGDLKWSFNNDYSLVIEGKGEMEPSYSGDYPWNECRYDAISIEIKDSVTSIARKAFESFTEVKTVKISNSVRIIGESAFSCCYDIEKVFMSDSVDTVGKWAFEVSTKIKDPIFSKKVFIRMPTSYSGFYEIPEGIETIAYEAFSNCKFLSSIHFPNTLTCIKELAFWGCIGIESLEFPNSLETIEEYAFQDCSNLKIVSMPSSVKTIKNAFYNAWHVDKLYWNNSINCRSYFSTYNELYLGDIVTSVPSVGNSMLKKVSLGKNVERLEAFAFSESPLEELYITTENEISLHSTAFKYDDLSNITLFVPSSKAYYYKNNTPWNEMGKILTIEGNEPNVKKCPQPYIEYSEGKIRLSSDLEKSSFECNISALDAISTCDEEIPLTATYIISAYAKHDGYLDSDVATVSLVFATDESGSQSSSIVEINSTPILYTKNGNTITIKVPDGENQVSFYSLDGKQITTSFSSNGIVQIDTDLISSDIIIIKIGNKSAKIMIH